MNTSFAYLASALLLLAGGAARTADETPQVQVALPLARDVTDYLDFTGHTQAVSTVELRARVTGYLDKVLFKDGSEVRRGDVLFEIDRRPYQAEGDRAQAVLVQAEARLTRASADLVRMESLLRQNAVGRAELDKATADREEARGVVQVAKAGHQLARLNLEFTRVYAPIDGRIGRRLLDPGNLVKADETVLGIIVSRDPVFVYFDVDERTLLRLTLAVRDGGPKAEPGKLPMAMGLATDAGFPRLGTVDFVDKSGSALKRKPETW